MLTTLTVYDIIYNALQYIGVISYGESIEPAVAKTGLQMLNAIRSEWSGKYLNYKKYDQTFTTSANTSVITLGSSTTVSGNILTRPAQLDEVIVIFGTNNYKIPLKTYEEYRQLTITNIFALPDAAYQDTEFPLMNVYLFPGLGAGYSARFMGLSYLPDYEKITDSLIDPPEYFNILVLALALRLAPMFGTDPNTLNGMIQMLGSALKSIKSNNFTARMKRPKNDLYGSTGGFNLLAGI